MAKLPTQSNRNMAIATTLGDDALLLESFSYSEDFSAPYRLTAVVTSAKPKDIAIEDTIGQLASIRVQRKDNKTRYFGGIVVRISQDARLKEKPRYELTIVPKFWLLSRNADCRIFQKKSIPDIIKKVFTDRGIDDSLHAELKGTYEARDFVVQYRESDFNFLSRLMEMEGIYYYHRHDKNGKHQMVLADDTACHEALEGYAEIPFSLPGVGVAPDRVSDWRCETEITTEKVTLRAFDFKAPNVKPKESQTLDFPSKWPSEIYDYPVEFHLPAEVKRHAKLRAEEYAAGAMSYVGQSDCRGLCCGGKFSLTDPLGQLRKNQTKEYLVIGVNIRGTAADFHSGAGGNGAAEEFACSFRCMQAKKAFRPARRTPKPVVAGSQTAIVVGSKGEEIFTDKYGRVKLQFHWDRESKADENSSCWVRVSQGWAGPNFGAFTIPRVGHEVIVDFLEGDPDRPIVTGRIHNEQSMPPYELPGAQTVSTIKSLSSKGGGGFNELRFEDKKDAEQVFIHAEKRMDVRVKKDDYTFIGESRHVIIETDLFHKVKNDHHDIVGNSRLQKVGKDCHLKIGGDHGVSVAGAASIEISKDYLIKSSGVILIDAVSGITLKCGGSSVVVDSAGVTIKGAKVTIDGSSIMIASGPGSPPGNASAVSLTAPEDPKEADNAEPGSKITPEGNEASTAASSSSLSLSSAAPGSSESEEQKDSWISIELKDDKNVPKAGEAYRLKTADGRIIEGTLDDEGKAMVRGIAKGSCEVNFPEIDGDEWRPT